MMYIIHGSSSLTGVLIEWLSERLGHYLCLLEVLRASL